MEKDITHTIAVDDEEWENLTGGTWEDYPQGFSEIPLDETDYDPQEDLEEEQ